jgi:hypothetical protein
MRWVTVDEYSINKEVESDEDLDNIPDINMYVCIPSGGQWISKFGKSLALMCSYFSTIRVFPDKSQRLVIATVESSMLCASRERLVTQSLRGKATHVLFLDSDMEFPMDTAHKLLRREKDFICAAYPTRSDPPLSVAIDLDERRVNPLKKHGVQKIQHGGFGVCLINCEQIKKLRPPLFLMDWIPGMDGAASGYCGEDVYFSQKMSEIGVDLWVDHDLSRDIGHVGYKRYDFNDVAAEKPQSMTL